MTPSERSDPEPSSVRSPGGDPMRPTLAVNPRHDAAFGAAAAALLDQAVLPSGLEGLLRAEFPNAVVRARDLSNEPGAVWYVYRDGRWTGSGGA